MALPHCTVNAALGYDWADPAAVYTDVTSGLLSKTITRGRQHELGQMQPGTCDLVFRNVDDRWYQWNTSSPYYPNIVPLLKFQVLEDWNLLTAQQSSVEDGTTTGHAVGTNCTLTATGSNALLGTHAVIMQASAAGNMSAHLDGYAAVAPNTTYTFVASSANLGNGANVRIRIRWLTSGLAAIGSDIPGAQVNDGVGGAPNYIQATATATSPANAAYADLIYEVMAAGNGDSHEWDGWGIFPGTDPTWSLGGTYYRFTGYAESFTPHTADVTDATMRIHVVDGFKILNYSKLTSTAYTTAVMADTPVGYYHLSDNINTGTSSAGDGSVHATTIDSSGNTNNGIYFGSPSFNITGALALVTDTAVDMGSRAAYSLLPVSVSPSSTTAFSVEAWVYPRSVPSTTFGDRIWSMETTAGQQVHLYFKNDAKLRFTVGDGTNTGHIESSVALPLRQWSHVIAVRAAGVASNWKLYVNGADVTTGATTDLGTGDPNLTGYSTMIAGLDSGGGANVAAFDGYLDEFAIYFAALSAGRATAHYDAAYGLAGQSLAGARFGNILDTVGWISGDRSLDAGQYQMQAAASLHSTSALAYLFQLVDSEGYPAAVFINGAGKVVFHDSAHSTPSSSATFGDNAGELHPARYDSFTPILDDVDIYNVITLQAVGGVPQTVSDSTSASKYGPRSPAGNSTTLQNASDTDVNTVATATKTRYKDPKVRMPTMAIHPTDDAGHLFPQVLGRELNDRITVNRHVTPGRGTALSLDLRIEGMTETTNYETGDRNDVWMLIPT